jgi:MFS family permease
VSAAAGEAAPPREPLVTQPFVLAFAAHFLHSLAFYIYLHLAGFLRGLGADELGIGVLSGVTAATAIAFRPWVGRSMDVRGRRGVILVGGVLHVVACALYLGVDRIGPLLVGARVLEGLSEAILFSALFAYAADIVPASRRIEGIALFGVSGMLPMALAALLGDAVLLRGTYTQLFGAALVLSFVALLLSVPLTDRRAADAPETRRSFWAGARQADLLPLWFVGTVFAAAIASYFTFLKTYVLSAGLGSVSPFFATYSVVAVGLRVSLGRLPDRFGPKRVLFPALGLLGVALALLGRSHAPSDLAVAGALAGIGHGYAFPILVGLVVGRARPSERGSALAVYTALFDVGTLLGAPVLGAVAKHGGYSTMFGAACGLTVVGAAVFGWWDWVGQKARSGSSV